VFNDLGSQEDYSMKEKLKLSGIIILIWVVWVILQATACKIAFGQTVTISPVLITSQKVVAVVDYSGPPTTVAAMNFKCGYDPTILQYDSMTAYAPFDTTGMLLMTTPGTTPGTFAAFYYISGMDSVWITDKPMFVIYFSVVQEGCSALHWETPPTDNCEISDITATPISTTWVDGYVCIITTGQNYLEQSQIKPVGERFDLIGRNVSSGGYCALNRKLIYKP
jgi:hypothetical protein